MRRKRVRKTAYMGSWVDDGPFGKLLIHDHFLDDLSAEDSTFEGKFNLVKSLNECFLHSRQQEMLDALHETGTVRSKMLVTKSSAKARWVNGF